MNKIEMVIRVVWRIVGEEAVETNDPDIARIAHELGVIHRRILRIAKKKAAPLPMIPKTPKLTWEVRITRAKKAIEARYDNIEEAGRALMVIPPHLSAILAGEAMDKNTLANIEGKLGFTEPS